MLLDATDRVHTDARSWPHRHYDGGLSDRDDVGAMRRSRTRHMRGVARGVSVRQRVAPSVPTAASR